MKNIEAFKELTKAKSILDGLSMLSGIAGGAFIVI